MEKILLFLGCLHFLGKTVEAMDNDKKVLVTTYMIFVFCLAVIGALIM